MLAVATLTAPAITWQQGAAEALPYADQSFDVVANQVGLMFFSLTVPKPSARWFASSRREAAWAVAVWGPLESSPCHRDEAALLERMAGEQAADAVRAPFVLGDRQALASTFADAGVAALRITTQQRAARFPSVRAMVEADLRGWLPVMGVVLSESEIAAILQEAEAALDAYVEETGAVAFPMAAHTVIGTRP